MNQPQTKSMTQIICDYANQYGVFGADEIRRIHGQKAALLCSRLAQKGKFTRIKNGVYTILKDASAQDNANENYLARIAENRAADALKEEPRVIDKLIELMVEKGSLSCAEASKHFGREMKGWFSHCKKKGMLKAEGNAHYSYKGEVPASRRESRPSVIPKKAEIEKIESLLASLPRMTAKQIAEKTNIIPVRLKDVLEHLVQKGTLKRHKSISTAAKATYSLVDKPAKLKDIPNEMLTALAMTASHGYMSARRLATHHLDNDATLLPQMEAYGLVARSGEDKQMGGASFVITEMGLKTLSDENWNWKGLPSIAHRPLFRAIMELSEKKDGTSILGIRKKTKATRNSVEKAINTMKAEGLIKTEGRPLIITRVSQAS